MQLSFPDRSLQLDRPLIMGILNITPDSFSDGGRFIDPDKAFDHARLMVHQGADILDIGGESTRPGASPVPVQQELDRVCPVIELLSGELDVPLSVDTSKPEVMRAAVTAGASMINDVMALRLAGALDAAAELGVTVCLMHMQGEPRSMQQNPRYEDVVSEVVGFLQERAEASQAAGIGRDRIILDPGFGFGKTLAHNLELLRGLGRLVDCGYPVLASLSRKSMIGKMLDQDDGDRLAGSLALAVLARQYGAHIMRVHDVGPSVAALGVVDVVLSGA